MDEKKILFSSIGWKFFERFSVQFVNLATQIVLARLIAPEIFGCLSIIVVFVNFADLLTQRGFGSSLIHLEKIKQGHINSVFVVSSCIAIGLIALIFFFAPFVEKFYSYDNICNSLRVLSLFLLFSPISCICNALLMRDMNFKAIFVRGAIASCCSSFVGIFLALKSFGIWALVAQMLVNQIFSALFMYFKVKKPIGISFTWRDFKDVFSFGRNVLLTEVMLNVVDDVRVLLIGKFFSSSTLAFYDRGQIYPATLMRAVNDSFFSAYFPFFSRKQSDRDDFKSLFLESIELVTLVIFPLFIFLAVCSSEVVIILLTEKWSKVIPFMMIFCFYQSIFSFQIVSKAALYAVGASKNVLKIEIVKSIMSIILLVVSLFYNAYLVAMSLIVVRAVGSFMYLHEVKKEIGDVSVFKKTWKTCVGSVVLFLLLLCINKIDCGLFTRLFLKGWGFILSYFMLVKWVNRELLTKFLKKVFK